MNKSIDILLKSLENQKITKHIVCPSARLLLSESGISLLDPIEIIDERSAGYVATGLCAEIEAPVVVWCADNDAYRNLASALTEAYYRKLPILVVALSCGDEINQSVNPNDTIRYYVNNTFYNRIGTQREMDLAISYLNAMVKGPVYLSVGSFRNAEDSMKEPYSNQIDVTSIANLIPHVACIHLGRDVSVDIEFKGEVICRKNHCTKEGNLSMLIGSSVVAREQLHVGVFTIEELSYDLNMLGSRHVDGNLVLFSLISKEQVSPIYEVAKRFGWDCSHINVTEVDSVKEKLVISDKPHYIEVVL